MAKNYVNYGFNYFISDLVKIPSVIKRYEDNLKVVDFYHIILKANLDELEKRDATRKGLEVHGREVIKRITQTMDELDYGDVLVVDTSEMNVEETLDYIFDKLGIVSQQGELFLKQS